MNIQIALKRLERVTVNNSPAILTAIGVAGTVTTAVFASKASFKAAELLQQEHLHDRLDDPKERFIEQTKMTWQLYIPAVGVGTATIACIIFANQIGTRRAAAMAAAYSMSEKAFAEYREKIVEKVGATKEQTARDEIAQERVDKNPASDQQIVMMNEREVLCYDQYSGRYFNSDMETLKKAQNDLNYQLLRESYASLNDFYDRVGLEWIASGDEVGWTCGEAMDLKFSTVLSKDQRPCIAIDFSVTPVRNYYKYY